MYTVASVLIQHHIRSLHIDETLDAVYSYVEGIRSSTDVDWLGVRNAHRHHHDAAMLGHILLHLRLHSAASPTLRLISTAIELINGIT